MLLLKLPDANKLIQILKKLLKVRNGVFKKNKKFYLYVNFLADRAVCGVILLKLKMLYELNLKGDIGSIKQIPLEFKFILEQELVNAVLNFTKKRKKKDTKLILILIEDISKILDIIKHTTELLNPVLFDNYERESFKFYNN
jgi:hypothetical protein